MKKNANTNLRNVIAEAKLIRDLAVENAKGVLVEAFTPTIQKLVSTKISEEEEDDFSDDELEDDAPDFDSFGDEGGEDLGGDEDLDLGSEDDLDLDLDDEGGSANVDLDLGDDGNLELSLSISPEEIEQILSGEGEEDLDSDLDDLGDDDLGDDDLDVDDDFEPASDDEDEDLDDTLESVLRELDTDTWDDNSSTPKRSWDKNLTVESKRRRILARENISLKKQNRILRKTLNEVFIINSRLYYFNDIIKEYKNSLSEAQKVSVLKAFDRANSKREIMLVHRSLKESFKNNVKKNLKPRKTIKESSSVRAGVTPRRPTNQNRFHDFAPRLMEIAGIKK